jgi:hypothetical protein
VNYGKMPIGSLQGDFSFKSFPKTLAKISLGQWGKEERMGKLSPKSEKMKKLS